MNGSFSLIPVGPEFISNKRVFRKMEKKKNLQGFTVLHTAVVVVIPDHIFLLFRLSP